MTLQRIAIAQPTCLGLLPQRWPEGRFQSICVSTKEMRSLYLPGASRPDPWLPSIEIIQPHYGVRMTEWDIGQNAALEPHRPVQCAAAVVAEAVDVRSAITQGDQLCEKIVGRAHCLH